MDGDHFQVPRLSDGGQKYILRTKQDLDMMSKSPGSKCELKNEQTDVTKTGRQRIIDTVLINNLSRSSVCFIFSSPSGSHANLALNTTLNQPP